MRLFILISMTLLSLTIAHPTQAQQMPSRIFKKGQLDVAASIGVVPTFFLDGARAVVPPVTAQVDYRLSNKFSLGLLAGYSISQTSDMVMSDGLVRYTNRFTFVGLRPAVHFSSFKNWDFSGGFQLSYNRSDLKSSHNEFGVAELQRGIKQHSGKLTYSSFVNARYVVNRQVTLLGELGYGVSLVRFGVGYRLI